MENIDDFFQNENLKDQIGLETEKIIEESGNWEARKPFKFGKDYFELQLEFAKELQKKSGESLFDIVIAYAPILRSHIFQYSKEHGIKKINPDVTEENIIDLAYKEYLKRYDDRPVAYHLETDSRFGCFYYDLDETRQAINLHFLNAEFGKIGPLDKTRIELRKKEIQDILKDIKTKYPDIKEIKSLSWLYNLPAFKRLFPKSFTNNLKINQNLEQWSRGTTIWGQFFNNQYKIKKELANELLQQVKKLSPNQSLSEVFKNSSLLMPPLTVNGPIEDFYKMYCIVENKKST